MANLLEELGASCNQCGRCCLELGGFLSGTDEDLARWEAAGERGAGILQWVSVRRLDGVVSAVDLWHDPHENREWDKEACPWVVQTGNGAYECGIYELRPDVCAQFPSHPEQIESMCIPGGVEVRLERPI